MRNDAGVDIARLLSAGRVLAGATLLLGTRQVAAAASTTREPPPGALGPLRMAAARDLAIGVGGLLAEDARRWVLAGAFSDAVDAVALAAERTVRPALRVGLSGGAMAAAVAGYAAARRR